MADCKHHKENMARCNCTYEPCSRKGYCCECLTYHLRLGVERTYDRSISAFIRAHKK